MLHRCLFNEHACFFMTTLMNRQCYQCVLDWGHVTSLWDQDRAIVEAIKLIFI